MKPMRSSGPLFHFQNPRPHYRWLWICCIWLACDAETSSPDTIDAQDARSESPSSEPEPSETTGDLEDGMETLTPGLAPNPGMKGMKGMKGSKRGIGPKGRDGMSISERPELVPASICSGIEEKSQEDETWTTWMTDNLPECDTSLTSEMNTWMEKDERCGKRFIGMQLRCLKRSETPTDFENCVDEQTNQLESMYEDKGVCIPDRSSRPNGMRGNGLNSPVPSRQ